MDTEKSEAGASRQAARRGSPHPSDETSHGAWTMVDVAQSSDSGDEDDEMSIVNISRAQSPMAIQFSQADLRGVNVAWPSSLPWFRFQDLCLNSSISRKLFARPPEAALSHSDGSDPKSDISSRPGQSLLKNASAEGFGAAVSHINKMMPERFDGENVTRVKALVAGKHHSAQLAQFQLFVFQLSNNLIELAEEEEDEYIDEYNGVYTKIIEIFRRFGFPEAQWTGLFKKCMGQPTGSAFGEALFEASVNDLSLDVCEALLESGIDPNQIIFSHMTGQQERAIQVSMDCRVQSLDLAKLLVRFGADVDLMTEEDDETALNKAVVESNVDSVRFLVESGARVRGGDCASGSEYAANTALQRCPKRDWRRGTMSERDIEETYQSKERPGISTLRYLLPLYDRQRDHGIIQDTFVSAACHGRRDMMKLLIEAGANIDEASSLHETALLAAVHSDYKGKNLETITMLLEYGADASLARKDSSGIAPIHLAAIEDNEGAVQALIKYKTDVNARIRSCRAKDLRKLSYGLENTGARFCHSTPLQLGLYTWETPIRSREKSSASALILLQAGATLDGNELPQSGQFGDIKLIEELLRRGADINETNSFGRSALDICLEKGTIGLAKYLLEAGAKLHGGELISAARAGSLEAFDMLMRHGATISHQATAEETLLEATARSKNWQLMAMLMEDHGIPYDEHGFCAAVCLGLGKSQENGKFLDALLRRRPHGATGGILEATALSYAASHGQYWLMNRLLLLHTTNQCIIPLERGDRNRHLACGRIYLRETPARFWRKRSMIRCSILAPVIAARCWDEAWRLLEAGYRPDRYSLLVAIAKAGANMPYDASTEDKREVEEESLALIIRFTSCMTLVDINAPAARIFDTPLQSSVRYRRKDVVTHLLSLGVDVNYPAPSEHPYNPPTWGVPLFPRTALQAAVDNGDMEMLDLLLEAGADVNGRPGAEFGATALQIAAGRGHIGIARRLISLGAEIDGPEAEEEGRSALEAAAEHGRLDMVQFLLESGAQIYEASDGQVTHQYDNAVYFAEKNGNMTIMRLLGSWLEKEKSKSEDRT